MALNIKNEQTVALARQLAEATGESLTEAIRRSLEERLAKVHSEDRDRLDRRELLWREIEQVRTQLGRYGDGFTDDDLYDPETGLPA